MSQNQEIQIASGDVLDVRAFNVTQAVSTLFSVTVTAVSKSADIDFESVVGRDASFTLRGRSATGEPCTWRGVLTELHLLRTEEVGLTTYRLRIEPTLWLASQRRNYRIFQAKSELEIARQLLEEWGVAHGEAISASYKSREYRVQYGETDYAFFARLLEEAGISFTFAERGDQTVCLLTDAPQRFPERERPIPFADTPGTVDDEWVTQVQVSRLVRPGKLELRDYDFRRPSAFVLAGTAATEGVEQRLESFHYEPGAFVYESAGGIGTPMADDRGMFRADEGAARHVAAHRLSAQRDEASTIGFLTNVIDLAPGSVLRILNHPQREVGDHKKLLVVASRIDGTHDQPIVHACELRSAGAAYHPPLRQEKPRAGGAESATVVGPPGEEIHVDEFGRVRVRFHWDREGLHEERSSCWIHVSQAWAGAGFGGVNLPRVGQEVVVDFFGGDPDRPVVTGRVYTNLQKTPYPLPEHKTKSGWRSHSSPSYGGYNEIMFEDRAGGELVHMRAQRNMTTQVNQDHLSTIGNNRSTSVGANETKSVGGNQTLVVQGDHHATTGADFTESVMGVLTSLASSDRLLRTEGNSDSQARTHCITSEQGTTLVVGSSMIHIGPDSIVIQTPKLLLNPGDGAATSAALGGPTKLAS